MSELDTVGLVHNTIAHANNVFVQPRWRSHEAFIKQQGEDSQGCQSFLAVKIYQDGNNIRALTIKNVMASHCLMIASRNNYDDK